MRESELSSILLMTACIRPGHMPQTALQDAVIRENQYRSALDFYLQKTNFPIVFVENSGVDISGDYHEAISDGRLEVLTFNGNAYNRQRGKGYGEGLILKYAFEHSKKLEGGRCCIKVSGRHVVRNINMIWWSVTCFADNRHFCSCNVNPKYRSALSDIFIADTRFFQVSMLQAVERVDESKGFWFEHALYEATSDYVKKGGEFVFLPVPPRQEGVSGSTGKMFISPGFRRYFLDYIKAVLYKLKLKNIS